MLILSLHSAGCANRSLGVCIREGKRYCITDEWIFTENFYSCYLRGISCSEGGCWEYARDEFLRALKKREEDGRWVRTYGMHRLPEYFPNRELGITFYNLADIDNALKHLLISLKHCESARAKYYIDKIRREKLILTKQDIESPRVFLEPYPQNTASPGITLSGLAVDDTYVASLTIHVKNKEHISLLEMSHPYSFTFHQKIALEPGLNDVLIKASDLLGKEDQIGITILLDQDGPLIYFAGPENRDFKTYRFIQGWICDPSDIALFTINKNRVELTRIGKDRALNDDSSYKAYWFQYPLSSGEYQRGIIEYMAMDSLRNSTKGLLKILEDADQRHSYKGAYHQPVRIAMRPGISETGQAIKSLFRIADNKGPSPVRIEITHLPKETFAEEISPQIQIYTSCQIKEIFINELSILSIYGLSWTRFITAVFRGYQEDERGGRFLFPRMIKLKEGENIIKIKVLDQFGSILEKEFVVVRRVKQIYKLDERWRIAIPLIHYEQYEQGEGAIEHKSKEITYQVITAFINQSRFKVIDLENLPILLEEKNLFYSIGYPYLRLNEEFGIWIDVFLMGYIKETRDTFTLFASLIDFETGEILATKDVYEEINPLGLLDVVWGEGLREHTIQNCSVLAAKFKEHFPLCEGKVVSINEEDIKTSICKSDGLKSGMKLIIFNTPDKEGDFLISGEAKVQSVYGKFSQARISGTMEIMDRDSLSKNLLVITR